MCVCASIRAQTLSRTVNCMMYYETLLRLVANLERVNEDTTDDFFYFKSLDTLYPVDFIEI